MPALLEALAQGQNRDYSLWRTSGTEWVPQAQLAVRGWPAARGICALLDGRFAHWGWQTAPAQSITADNP